MTVTLRHEALPFSGRQEFVRAAVERFDAALDRDAVPVLLHDAPCASDVREGLGHRADQLRFFDMCVDGRNPARVLPALQRLVDDHAGAALCLIGEPVRPDHSEQHVAETQLVELLLHLPEFAAWNCSLTCGYDRAGLPADVADEIERSHRARPADAADQVARLRAQPLPPRPADSEELGVDRTTLGALRGFIQARAGRAGIQGERADDLVYAVNEVVTNSLCHGEGRARVSFWSSADAVVCEVRDRGWIRDPLAGRVAPNPNGTSGRGLWLVNQLCDLVQLRSSPSGTTLRLYIDAV